MPQVFLVFFFVTVVENCYWNSWHLNKESHSWEGLSVETWLGSFFSLTIWVPKLELKNLFCWLWCHNRVLRWVSARMFWKDWEESLSFLRYCRKLNSWNCFLAFMVPQSFGCMPGNWRYSLWCLQEAALVFLVSQSCCYRYRALWCSFLCGAASCAHPLLGRASRKKQCFLISLLEGSNPEVILGIVLYFFFTSAVDKLFYAFLDFRFWFGHFQCFR